MAEEKKVELNEENLDNVAGGYHSHGRHEEKNFEINKDNDGFVSKIAEEDEEQRKKGNRVYNN